MKNSELAEAVAVLVEDKIGCKRLIDSSSVKLLKLLKSSVCKVWTDKID